MTDMRAAARRDPDFRAIDPPALDHLVRQVQDARSAIAGWLAGHRPPPGVAATGYREAEEVAVWLTTQFGMLSRRYSFAITHPDPAGGVGTPPAAPAPRSGGGSGGTGGGGHAPAPHVPRLSPVHAVTPHGAGDLGNFPTREDALKAARGDAGALLTALEKGEGVPADVWAHLKADAGDPDYAEALYEQLGPSGVAALVAGAGGDQGRLAAIRESLGVASHHTTIDAAWMRTFLADARRDGAGSAAVAVLTGAPLSAKSKAALAKLDLGAPAGTVR
ncbi:hypothetical protein [Actinomadura rayongensis]|uniref:Uncharacterized protein n=1 Tax=Actinomadura rayongensis TaxID=1429076 RepID=A0A6I4W6V5_9ACTN|nr:hypothetical protein [Actinomadura rayongensis]MXQ63946.1 hypothetical protein [Actinomadura rayongensis]